MAMANRNTFLVPDPIAEPARGRDPHREAQQVAEHHPFDAIGADVEVLGESRERHVDDSGVHDLHEQAGHVDDCDLGFVFEWSLHRGDGNAAG